VRLMGLYSVTMPGAYTDHRHRLADMKQIITAAHSQEADTKQVITADYLADADTEWVLFISPLYSAAMPGLGVTQRVRHIDTKQVLWVPVSAEGDTKQIIWWDYVIDADTMQIISPGQPAFAFAGKPVQDYGIMLLRGTRRELIPGQRSNIEVIPGRHGALDLGAELEPRQFELRCAVKASTRSELLHRMRQIAALFNPANGVQPLAFDSEPAKTYYARVNSVVDLQSILTYGVFDLVFIAPDPFAYGQEVTANVNDGDSVTLANAGTWSTPLTITMQASGQDVVDPAVTVGGKQIKYTGTLAVGSTLTIETDKMTAVLDGQNALANITGEFMMLQPGDSQATPSKASGGTLTVTFTFKPRWL